MDRQEQAGGQGKELVTRAARIVLADCVLAHKLLDEETDEKLWRVHWVGALSLIRAVGNVLEKIDGTDPIYRKISNAMFRAWLNEMNPEHQIFRDFIKHERDLMLKEYSTSVNLDSIVPLLVLPVDVVSPTDQNIFRPMESGPWAGEDARDIYQLAIEWWVVQLEKVDSQVAVEKSTQVVD